MHEGIFETVLIVDGVVRELPPHMARLRRSFWECYRVPLDLDADAEVRRTAAPYAGYHRARIVATPEDPTRLRVEVQPCDPPVPLEQQPGLMLQVRRAHALAPHKFVDRDALNHAEIGLGSDEAVVFADYDGLVLEGSRSNIFVVRDGQICTPPLDGRILPGVSRQLILNYADDIGVPVAIAPISLDELAASEGAFLTNSIRGVQWVRRTSGAEWVEPHPLTRLIASHDAG
ncbi:branched-subunit amino acid aminotransferase/4-amino-4-deoxychorismate lyase [Antricoccus suffuscus]|uniref:Branched-subunit amino acid aminotransferase/4-amino-4-deoxychorismate lyase n=1 Tax=Antricoccus suffuscus TaxID=1629062 RepID=A0A2T1A6X2_9ACTN|nr:branched-subunit amino acid aminotransferase/4-amino-4-deoxychorismate lyase [Antricoccus suffuscus]